MLISLISILLLTYFSPYIDPRVDAVSWASQTATLLTLLGGAALTGSQGPECDCDEFLSIVNVTLPIVNMLPLIAIVYLIASTVTDLYASQTFTPQKNPNPNPDPNPEPKSNPNPHPNPTQVRRAAGAQAATPVRGAFR